MKVFMMPQISPEWYAVHRGIPSASNFDRIITAVKGDLSKQAEEYIDELIADVLCQSPNYFTQRGTPINSWAIQRGVDLEPQARRWLALESNLDVSEVGFCVADDFSIGSSPDGLIGLEMNPEAEGEYAGQPYFAATVKEACEMKVPLLKTHIGWLRRGVLPTDHKVQCHGHMVVTGANACRFLSWAEESQFQVLVHRDEYTDKVEKAAKEFVAMFQDALEKVRRGR